MTHQENNRSNSNFQNYSRNTIQADNRTSFRAFTPVTYRWLETPKKESFTAWKDPSPNFRNNTYQHNTSIDLLDIDEEYLNSRENF